MTMHDLFDELDIIKCFGHPSHRFYFGEITKKQTSLYTAPGVEDPSLV